MPFGHLPVLVIEGTKMLAQSNAIARYLARHHGLAGKDIWEQAQADMFADNIKDLIQSGSGIYRETDPEKQQEMGRAFFEETLVPHMAKIEEILQKNGGLLVGKSVTWADIMYYAFFANAVAKFPETLKDSPHLKALMDRIEQNPNIKRYLATRPVTEH